MQPTFTPNNYPQNYPQNYSAGQAMPNGMANNAPVVEQPKKNFLAIILGAVAGICLLLAVVLFISQSKTSKELNNLKKQISEGGSVEIDGVTTTIQKESNPKIVAKYPDVFNVVYESKKYTLGDGLDYDYAISVNDGQVVSCLIRAYSASSNEDTKQCSVSGISGDIFKIVLVPDLSDPKEDLLAFILTDGTVDFAKAYSGIDSMTFNIAGKIKVGGFVTDALVVKLFTKDSVGGNDATVFLLSDGSYQRYKKSMLYYN